MPPKPLPLPDLALERGIVQPAKEPGVVLVILVSPVAGGIVELENAEDAVRAAAAKIGAKVAPPSTTVDVDVETK